MSRVVSLRLKEDEAKRIERLARQFSRSVGATASLLLREKLREEDFPLIEFRSSGVGRQPYLKGHRLAVWEVVYFTRQWSMDAKQYAEHLNLPEWLVEGALAYARAFPDEIEPIVTEVQSTTIEDLRRIVPGFRRLKCRWPSISCSTSRWNPRWLGCYVSVGSTPCRCRNGMTGAICTGLKKKYWLGPRQMV